MISESIFQKNLEGLTYKERAEIDMADLNQKIQQITQFIVDYINDKKYNNANMYN